MSHILSENLFYSYPSLFFFALFPILLSSERSIFVQHYTPFKPQREAEQTKTNHMDAENISLEK